ncbi:MAG: 23S rRNA (pseudouridine(1915)-N(3))-methyltransferase RlmH [Hyphomicrobiales bacterium]|nr:23S rRNA (pseudouridine(1915)-N(3))-methyltransferase RlmH [Hyphomicrobiales bacterium]
MRLVLHVVGRLKAGPERDLCAHWLARCGQVARRAGLSGPDLREIDESPARRAADRKAEEARALRTALPPGATLVLFDETGENLGSRAFADFIAKARLRAAPAAVFALGGPDGHDPALRPLAAKTVAFGAMTWPHGLARIMAAEQLYRAASILVGSPYHRD